MVPENKFILLFALWSLINNWLTRLAGSRKRVKTDRYPHFLLFLIEPVQLPVKIWLFPVGLLSWYFIRLYFLLLLCVSLWATVFTCRSRIACRTIDYTSLLLLWLPAGSIICLSRTRQTLLPVAPVYPVGPVHRHFHTPVVPVYPVGPSQNQWPCNTYVSCYWRPVGPLSELWKPQALLVGPAKATTYFGPVAPC